MKTLTTAGIIALACAFTAGARQTSATDDTYTKTFRLDPDELVSAGRNPYFILEPGYTLVLDGGGEHLVITVLNETRKVDNVDTRIIEERETKDGQLVEVSRNYFAISRRTNSVFYFGEDVDMYAGGKIVSHEGAWLAGVNGAAFGLMMPGLPLLRARYSQEVAPGIALDRAEIASLTDTLKTPAGTFTNVLRTLETTPLEPQLRETKYYAWGIGLAQEGDLKLTKYGK
jgi:hypothetical protein